MTGCFFNWLPQSDYIWQSYDTYLPSLSHSFSSLYVHFSTEYHNFRWLVVFLIGSPNPITSDRAMIPFSLLSLS